MPRTVHCLVGFERVILAFRPPQAIRCCAGQGGSEQVSCVQAFYARPRYIVTLHSVQLPLLRLCA